MGTVQEICKKFEEFTRKGSNETVNQIYSNKAFHKQYKSMTTLNNKEEINESNCKNTTSEFKDQLSSSTKVPTYAENSNLELNSTEIRNHKENGQSTKIYQNLNSLNEQSDISSIGTRRKDRDFKSITQQPEENNIRDNTKYYSHPHQAIRNKHNDTEIYKNVRQSCDSQISNLGHIVDELVSTEESFVLKLKAGYENYKTIFENQHSLPKGLIGKRNVLFRSLEEILDFHQNEMLPMLQINHYDLEQLFMYFSEFIEENKFYPHLMYIMHKKRAENLCKYYKSFFDERAKEFDDKLGIMSLLIQPLHRVTKYPLLLQQIIKDCFKNYSMKPILQLCCKTEKRMTDYVKLINESERVGNIIDIKDNVNLYEEGRLKKVDKFYIYDYNLQRRFKSRVFLFERSLVYTEIFTSFKSETLKFRGIFPNDKLSISIKDPGFTLHWERRNIHDCDLEAKTEEIKNAWIEIIKNIILNYFEKKRLQSGNSSHITAYSNLFRYRFLNGTNRNSNRTSIISNGSFNSSNNTD